MKKKFSSIAGFVVLYIFISCGAYNQDKYFKRELLPISEHEYTLENPLVIKGGTARERENRTAQFLETLTSSSGEKYVIISKSLVLNPNYREPRIKLYNVFTDEVINAGKGKYLEMYTLHSRQEKDTIKLYINSGIKSAVKLPEGLGYSGKENRQWDY